jgi:4-amino-4-deoxy-L-arabinose transferase-like glycosyltransferase
MEETVQDARTQTGQSGTPVTDPKFPSFHRGQDLWRLLILMALVAGIRIWLLCHTEVAARDSIGYIRYALELEKEPWPEVFRHSLQHPGYPILIQIISHPIRYYMGGLSPLSMQVSAQIVSALTSLLLVIPTFYLGCELFNRKIAFWATLLFQCLPAATRVMSDGLSEATFFLFLSTALLLGIRGLRTGSTLGFAWCGLFSGLAYLTRPEGILAILAVGLVLVGMHIFPERRWLWRRGLLCGGSMVLAALLVGSPFAITIRGFTTKPTGHVMLDLRAAPKSKGASNAHGPVSLRSAREESSAPHYSLTSSLLAVYAPARLQHRTLWSFKAIGVETVKGYQYVLAAPLLLGLWLSRKMLASSPAGWVLLFLCGLHLVVLWRLATVMGYVSDRHVLVLVFCGIFPAAAGCALLSNRLADALAWLWGRYRRVTAPGTQAGSLALLLLIGMTTFSLPEVLKPMHANRSGHREAGEWLAQHAQACDRIVDPFCWAHFFAGRVFVEGQDAEPPPGYQPLSYVIVEHADHEHVRLPMLAIAEEYAGFGRPVYHWPENKAEESAKVLVYLVTDEDLENARKRALPQ